MQGTDRRESGKHGRESRWAIREPCQGAGACVAHVWQAGHVWCMCVEQQSSGLVVPWLFSHVCVHFPLFHFTEHFSFRGA